MKFTVAACLIARDNEATIEAAILSVKRHVDVIVLLDTGSSDRTASIAREAGAIVHSERWFNDFAAIRNTCVRLTNADWVLFIDADEQFIWENETSLSEWIMQNANVDSVFAFSCEHYESEPRILLSKTHVERLFSPRHYHFIGRIHEQLVPNPETGPQKKIALNREGFFIHFGYSSEFHDQKGKRNRKLLQMSIDENPEAYHLYRYLANELYNQGKYQQAIKSAETALDHLSLNQQYLRSQSHYYKIMSYIRLKKWKDAETAAINCTLEVPEYSDPYAVLGEICYHQNRWNDAVKWYSLWQHYQKSDFLSMLPCHIHANSQQIGEHKQYATWFMKQQLAERGKSRMNLAVVYINPELENDWEDVVKHVQQKFHDLVIVQAIWNPSTRWNISNSKSWFKQSGVGVIEAHSAVEAGLKLAASHQVDLIWFWDANERVTSDINPEMLVSSVHDNGKIQISYCSDRLQYNRFERRIWPVELLSTRKHNTPFDFMPVSEMSQRKTINKKTLPTHSATVEIKKPLIIALDKIGQYETVYRYSDPTQKLLVAFGSQRYDQVLEMSEPNRKSKDWATFRFFRILSAYNANQVESGSEWLYEAMEWDMDSLIQMDFIYLYGKLALNVNISEMKKEACELLENTIHSYPILECFHIVTTESQWLALIAELQWQMGNRKKAILSMRHSLESSTYLNVEAAYRLAEMVYEENKNDGVDTVARTILDMFSVQSSTAPALLFPVFSYLNMQEWALLFQNQSLSPVMEDLDLPLVSIILPVYNDREYLFDAIHSILCQTYLNLELIVVDDGSTVDVNCIVSRFLYDSRVKLLRIPKNRGLPSALNHGFSHAKGSIMGWTSADNKAHPRWLERMVQSLLTQPQASAVFSDYYHIDEHGIVLETKRMSGYRLNGLQNGGPSLLWKKDAYRQVGGFDPSLLGIEDRDFTIRLALTGSIVRLPEPLYYYRIHSNSLSSKIESGAFGGWSSLHNKLKNKWLHFSFV